MLRNLLCVVSVFSLIVLNSCASNQGGTGAVNNSGTGTAALSLQIEEGATGLSQNGYQLTFTTFALAFSAMTLGDQALTDTFTADFFDEEITDIVELEEVPTGEYDTVTLTLGTASDLSGTATLVASDLLAAAAGTAVTESLNGLSVLIIAAAQNGADTCTVRVELVSDATITVHNEGDAHIEIGDAEEAEVLIAVDPDAIFGTLNIPNNCTGDATVTISVNDNADLGTDILTNLAQAFHMESTDGHAHNHD